MQTQKADGMKTELASGEPSEKASRAVVKSGADVAEVVIAATHLSAAFADALKSVEPELSFTHWDLLNLLRRDGPMRPFQAAARLRISRQLVFQAAKKLGRLGYIDFSSEQDRRAVTISLSEAGSQVLDRVETRFRTVADVLSERVPTANLRPLRTILGLMTNGFDTRR
nr:MarR family transcriptional regulator [Paracoccus saliphilus]